MSRYKVLIQQFGTNVSEPLYKQYSIGVYFDAGLIKRKISSIQNMFVKTFLQKFLLPYLLFVAFFLVAQVMYDFGPH